MKVHREPGFKRNLTSCEFFLLFGCLHFGEKVVVSSPCKIPPVESRPFLILGLRF